MNITWISLKSWLSLVKRQIKLCRTQKTAASVGKLKPDSLIFSRIGTVDYATDEICKEFRIFCILC